MLSLYKKKGDKLLPSNCRPISLTFIVGKLIDSIIRDILVTLLKENIMIDNSQHGFRYKRSCLTNLLDFYNDVFNIFDEIKAIDIIHLDFQKPFGGGLVPSGWAYQLRIPRSSPATGCHFSMVIPLSGLRTPTCCHNNILDGTARLYP